MRFLLHFQHFALNGAGQAKAAIAGDLLAVFVHHQRTEHGFALTAAEHAVGGNAFEHLIEELGNQDSFKLAGDFLCRRRIVCGMRAADRRILGQHHRTLHVRYAAHPITWISACSAPEALMACRIEMMSRGPTPSAFRPSTRLCSDTPSCSTVILLPLLSS